MANYFIDKSKFDAEQLAQYEALVAIGKSEVPSVEPPAPATPTVETPVVEKSEPAEFKIPAFILDAVAKSDKYIEDQEKKAMVELAKKYEILDLKPDELGVELYEMKKSNESSYNTCISILDKQLTMIEKSGVLGEIGKSGNAGGHYSGLTGAEAKAEAKAQEIMKAAPNITYTEAKAMAWDDPAIAAEYESEYNGR